LILTFPNYDVLRLALTCGAIPARVSLAPARATSDGLIIEPSLALDDAALAELRRLDVTIANRTTAQLDLAVVCWPQLLPLERDARPHGALDNTAILFDIDARKLPVLVSEILRLGNDRQSFRWFDAGDVKRALVRVIGPPYYSLLRALDDPDSGDTVAYRECAPRVWQQLGWMHPLTEQIQAPPGRMLLMRRPRSWTFVEEGRFRDIYEVLDFTLPAEPMAWREVEQDARIQVPVRLANSGNTGVPELWVLHEDALAQIDSLVQNADDQLIARLTFAVAERDGNTMVALRVRPSKEPPPVLVLNALGYRPYLKLANLFVPQGQRLHPPLRRDAVAKLLVRDSQQITWLNPDEMGSFTPENLPETAFRPLSQWVDYVLDRDHVALTAWVNAHRFDFERFVCADDKPAAKPPKDRRPRKDVGDEDEETSTEKGPVLEVTNKSRPKKKQDKPLEALAVVEPSQLETELIELETQFVALKSPLDSPERQALWPRIARLCAALGNADDAHICCGNALWEADPRAAHDWLRECREHDRAWADFRKMGIATILKADELRIADLRILVLSLLGAAPPEELAPHLGRIQQHLEKHEHQLGIRLVWLAWEAVHRLAHGDVLALARARDRLLERLYLTGLSADLDLPGFLRVSGAMSSERYRQVRDHMQRMRPLVHQWTVSGVVMAPDTQCYADLMFAYAFAQLGEPTQAHKLLREAQEKVSRHDDVHNWLFSAFKFRINEALEGKSGANRFPAPMLETLEITDRLARYKIDRLREHSRILEPHEKIDPYRRWHGRFADDLSRELALLYDIDDRAKLAKQLGRLLSPKKRMPEPRVYAAALELAPRLGESFATDLLYQVEQSFAKTSEPMDVALLIEKSLFLAAHYDNKDEVQDLAARFDSFLSGKGSNLPTSNLETLLGASFRGLRKLGLREEAARLLERMAAMIQARKPAKNTVPEEQAKELRLLLQIASGWLYFGDNERARAILDSARTLLFDDSLPPPAQTQLACAYATALGQAPLEVSMPRLLEMFRKVNGVQDAYTTNSHYSLSRLDVIEAAILALVTDDFKVSPEARRWLDDDEFLVRRRIHHTMRIALGNAGL
jgi:hypothetical protein